MSAPAKITYTSACGDLNEFHHRFDVALEAVRAAAGARHPFYIGGQPVDHGGEPLVDRSPIDTGLVLGRFAAATRRDVDRAVAAARAAQPDWARLALARTARDAPPRGRAHPRAEVRAGRADEPGGRQEPARGDGRRRGVGRPDRLLLRAGRGGRRLRPADGPDHAGRAEHGRASARMACSPASRRSISRWRSPQGCRRAALAAGNAVVYKPAEDTPWTGPPTLRGLPRRGAAAGRLQPAGRPPGGDRRPALAASRRGRRGVHRIQGGGDADSRRAQRRLDQALPARARREERGDRDAQRRPRRGGRGRDAVGLQPAEPEVQRHQPGLRAPRRRGAVHRAAAGADPRHAHGRSLRARRLLRPGHQRARGGAVRAGGRAGAGGGGRAARRSAARRAASSTAATSWRRRSLCCRSRARCSARSCSCRSWRSPRWEASTRRWPETNAVEYGLTAGIFSGEPAEVERFFDEVEAGVCYANKRTGATTGAWPGAQPFCGWKGSGSTGKGGCGPYYVAQFAREQSRTVIETAVVESWVVSRRVVYVLTPDDSTDSTTTTRGEPQCQTIPRSSSPRRGPRRGRSSSATSAGPPPATSRSTRWSWRGGRASWWRTWTATGILDFMAGIAVSSTGYGHPKVVAAVKDAADRFLHICGSDFYYEGMAALCERLARHRAGHQQEAGVPHQLRHRGRGGSHQARPLRHPAYGDHRLSRRVPRADHRGGEPHQQQGATACRLRSPAARRAPRPVRLPLPLPVVRRRAGVQPRLPRRASSRISLPAISTRMTSPPSSSSRSRAKAATSCRRPGGSATCAPSATVTASCSWPTRCSRASAGPGRCGPATTRASSPTSCSPPRGSAPACRSARSIAKESITTWESGSHGSTFGGNPVCCAAALATLDLVEGGLMANAVGHGRAAAGRRPPAGGKARLHRRRARRRASWSGSSS